MTPCSQEDNLQQIRGTHCLQLYLSYILKKNAACSSKTFETIRLHSVILQKTATFNIHCHKNLTSRNVHLVSCTHEFRRNKLNLDKDSQVNPMLQWCFAPSIQHLCKQTIHSQSKRSAWQCQLLCLI
jgi:hypothetical protein